MVRGAGETRGADEARGGEEVRRSRRGRPRAGGVPERRTTGRSHNPTTLNTGKKNKTHTLKTPGEYQKKLTLKINEL